MVPMTRRGTVLRDHALVVRDGRILDLLPTHEARQRYAAGVVLERPTHLLAPGLVNTHSDAALSLCGTRADSPAGGGVPADLYEVSALVGLAAMLRSGITCFVDRHHRPDAMARIASEQGMRAVVGMPVSAAAGAWAGTPAESLTRALRLRDEYRDHPLISTAFAPHAPNDLCDAALAQLATLADELDAPIILDLHRSSADIDACLRRHGMRPVERLSTLGLLTPALIAVHWVHASASDIDLAQRTGISVALCPHADLSSQDGLPSVRAVTAAALRASLGSGGGGQLSHELWPDMQLLALLACDPWEILGMATRGGAEVLGAADFGTLEAGKWADLCCLDLGAPALWPPRDVVPQLILCGGRDLVTDVWIAGRHLLNAGAFTRLDWPDVAARAAGWAARISGE